MRLILIRHGQTTANVDYRLDTAIPGADLTDLGRRQPQPSPRPSPTRTSRPSTPPP